MRRRRLASRVSAPGARGVDGLGWSDCEAQGERVGPGPGVTPRRAVSIGHWIFSLSVRCFRVAKMTAPDESPLAPLLETLEDHSASPGEQTDAYLTLTR